MQSKQRVVLKSKVGPLQFTRRFLKRNERGIERYEMEVFDFNFNNDFRQSLPTDYWESLKDSFFDKENNVKYRDLLQELFTDTSDEATKAHAHYSW